MAARLITEEIVEPGLGEARFCVDASAIGLNPGEWPERLPTNMGNKLDFFAHGVLNDTRVYRQVAGCIELLVFND